MTRVHGVALVLLLLGIFGVVSTYSRLSQTSDEPFHTWCGMEWWENGTYTRESLHPPLTRIMDAALIYLTGAEKTAANMPHDKAYIYKTNLKRLGTLPFYVFSCFLVFFWSRDLFGETSALWSLALYITLSSVTAHAGLATTDMGYTAMFLWAVMSAIGWLRRPDLIHSIFLGESLGLMIGAKFSSLVQWPAAMSGILIAQIISNHYRALPLSPIRRTHILTSIAVVIPLAILMLGLLYHFSFNALFDGIASVRKLNHNHFAIWLFGPLRNHAVWYFFPVVFFFKTPLPFHIAAIFGNGNIISRFKHRPVEQFFPLVAASMIMLISMTSNINLGVRHVLTLYPLLAVPAGYGLQLLWQSNRWKRILAVVLILWQTMNFIAAYPEHVAYFNELAGSRPEHIVIDSDFDWGQGVVLLSEALQAHAVSEVYLCTRGLGGTGDSTKALVQAKILACPREPIHGWIAISRAILIDNVKKFSWLNNATKVETIGKTLELYYVPP